mmetsp:Transcript_13506/g.35153  ORF Transcript_13506/g.35153 Transcript_13506/m.35153 type:complete len:98 (+) Transcript_13506:50-343(+)
MSQMVDHRTNLRASPTRYLRRVRDPWELEPRQTRKVVLMHGRAAPNTDRRHTAAAAAELLVLKHERRSTARWTPARARHDVCARLIYALRFFTIFFT